MKKIIWVMLAVILLIGCQPEVKQTTQAISGTQELVLNEQDLTKLGMADLINAEELQQLGLDNGTNCRTEIDYSNVVDSSLGQYSICAYTIPMLNNTQLVIEFQKFANRESLNGSYQYSSLHYYSVEGLISENTFGDQSRFRVNNENDYGGQFNPPGIYYYRLWFTKDLYLIHITSKGSNEAQEYITKIGQQILSKFDSKNGNTNSEMNCTSAGQSADEYSFGKYIGPKKCCGGLIKIDDLKGEECFKIPDSGTICSDCGNGNCEGWENPCNCQKDCK